MKLKIFEDIQYFCLVFPFKIHGWFILNRSFAMFILGDTYVDAKIVKCSTWKFFKFRMSEKLKIYLPHLRNNKLFNRLINLINRNRSAAKILIYELYFSLPNSVTFCFQSTAELSQTFKQVSLSTIDQKDEETWHDQQDKDKDKGTTNWKTMINTKQDQVQLASRTHFMDLVIHDICSQKTMPYFLLTNDRHQ